MQLLLGALDAIHAGRTEEARAFCLKAIATDPTLPACHGLASLLERDAGLDASPRPRTRSSARVSVRTFDESPPRQRRASLEALVASMVKHISESAPHELDHEIGQALGELGLFVEVDRAYLFAPDPGGLTFSNTHEWVAAGITSEMAGLQELPAEAFGWTFDQFAQHGVIDCADIDDLPDAAAAERSSLKAQGIRSVLLVPFSLGGRSGGFVGFDAVRQQRPWQDDDITLLKVAAAVLGVAVERTRTDRTLSERDSRIFAVMSALPDLVLGLDVSGRVLLIKESQDLQPASDEVRARTLDTLVPPDLAEAFRSAALLAVEGAGLQTLRYSRDGGTRQEHYEARFARQDATSAVAVVRNITQQVEATDLLEEHRGLLQRLAARQLIVEEELRAETARLIHDGIGQDLAMSALLLKQARSELDAAAPRAMLDGLRVIDGAISKVRELSLSLSPPALLELGLTAATDMTGRDLASRHGLDFEFDEVTTTDRLPRPMEILIYRIVRELMINVIKHAQASRLSVFIECHEERLTATIEDDGVGLEPTLGHAPREGFGLLSIREQLTPLAGRLTLQPAAPRGLIATLIVPHPFHRQGVDS